MKRLPVGIHTFSQIRNEDYLYIDKTQEAYELINNYKYVFLSRPRRFGKSLFLTTLKEIFEGNKDLFKGLYIYDKYDFESFPVIRIVFSGVMSTEESLNDIIKRNVCNNEEDLRCEGNESLSSTERFAALIKNAATKYNKPVVILIDEYDKPILDNITDAPMRSYARDVLKGLYEHIKYNDEYIKFVFLTGVTKFAKVSVFSGLNNLSDISLAPQYGNICGYTQADIDTHFQPYLEGIDLGDIKRWYDGYNFLKDNVYNPFDILKFCTEGKLFRNYWFESGTPTFLIRLMQEKNFFPPDLQNIKVGEEILQSFDIDNIELPVLLYQAGYLTIKKAVTLRGGLYYQLRVPNFEVQKSLNEELLNRVVPSVIEKVKMQDNLYSALEQADLETFKNHLVRVFAHIPYHNYSSNYIAQYEGFYASVIYTYLYSLNMPFVAEDCTNQGRIDMSITVENNVYIIEFKMGTGDGIAQIMEKKYYEKYQNQGKNIYLVSINFDAEKKNISECKYVVLK
ncbi:MAG: AAA family ATPase [Treponema sp.]|uniref:ATP-binding protein n=1 Tax=Treponema sp. TaxID=166 RepID=UPI003FA28832